LRRSLRSIRNHTTRIGASLRSRYLLYLKINIESLAGTA
jgi:hypothetical protein